MPHRGIPDELETPVRKGIGEQAARETDLFVEILQGLALRRWLNDQVMTTYEARILPLSGTVAMICAALHIPDPKAERDAWIAATALDAGLTLATRNLGDFAGMGVALINPFEQNTDC